MIITILLFLFSDTTVADKFFYERLKGQCSAWCNQKYGNWTETDPKGTGEHKINVYLCKEGNQLCRDCNIACKYEFNNLGTCYQKCNKKTVCDEACRYHEQQSRVKINIEDYKRNLSNPYPPDIHVLAKTNDSLQLWWTYVEQYSEPRAMVFLFFLVNITSPTSEELEDSPGLYIGSTPEHKFLAHPLSADYCYKFRVLTVTQEFVLGHSIHDGLFATEAVVHVDNITATSAYIWFRIRMCESNIEFSDARLFYDTSSYSGPLRTEVQESKYEAFGEDLLPNKEYLLNVVRTYKGREGEMYAIHAKFRTLPAPPHSTAIVRDSNDVTADSITFSFSLSNKDEMWGLPPLYYVMKVASENGDYSEEQRIHSSMEFGTKTLSGLQAVTTYCVTMAVANQEGLGPFNSEPYCSTTSSRGAGPPLVKLFNRTSLHVWLRITRPDPPNGILHHYNVSFVDTDELKNLEFPVEDGNVQNILIPRLNQDTLYSFSVKAVNTNDDVGESSSIQIKTLESYPEKAPNVSSCDITSNASHVITHVTWQSVEEDFLNGEVEYYSLNLVQVHFDSLLVGHVVSNSTYLSTNWGSEVMEVPDPDIELDFSEQEVVTARLSVATKVGPGPWSRDNFTCTIVPPVVMGKDVVQYIVPVVCVFGLCVILLLVFMYFFRFKPYKKTPYEEIPKLIGPDTFSPCQHCLQNKDPKRWDVFICHVSEDTEYIVKLKNAFVREKIEVFFSKDELSWGDELHRVINDGLRYSKYGLVVLSKDFVNKSSKWTSSELSSLHSKSKITSQDCILPIWKKDITAIDVGEFDMTLVGILALKEEELSVDQMAVELKKKLRNDGCWGCSLRILNQNSGESTPKSSDLLIGGSSDDRQLSSPDEEGTNV